MNKKVFISFDYEGLAGVSNWDETNGNKRFDILATEQLCAYIEGILEVYPKSEITICDSHAYGTNIIWEKLPSQVSLVKGYPRNFYMVETLDKSFTDFVLFGYHSPIGQSGVMDHSYSASSIHNVWINDKIVGESEINTYVASFYDVPLKFFFSDSEAVKWMKENVTNEIDFLISKETISRFSAKMFSYEWIINALRNAGKTSLDKKGFLYDNYHNLILKIELSDTNLAYGCSIIPNATKIDGRTITFDCKDPIEMYKYLMTVIAVSKSLRK